MPLYVFKCPTCDSTFEKISKIGTTLTQCMSCSDMAIKQLSAPASFTFNGTEFSVSSSKKTEPTTN